MTNLWLKLKYIAAFWVIMIVIALSVQLGRAERRAIAAGFRADSTAAVLDTTRELSQGFVRRAVQAEIARDSVAKQLKVANALIVEYAMSIEADSSIVADEDMDVEDLDDGTRLGRFGTEVGPANITVEVALAPADSNTSSAKFQVTFDPIQVSTRLVCGQASPEGVRPASIVVDPPAGMTLEISRAEVDPSACNAKALNNISASHRKTIVPFVVGGTLAALATFLITR